MLDRILLILVLVFVGLFSVSVNALSVADIELNSYLNQTLNAKIGLSDLKSGDLDSLNIRIIDINNGSDVLPGSLKFEVLGEGNKHFIHITSSESIREPILSFSLELSWGQGRLIRDYDLLIDPIR